MRHPQRLLLTQIRTTSNPLPRRVAVKSLRRARAANGIATAAVDVVGVEAGRRRQFRCRHCQLLADRPAKPPKRTRLQS